MKFSYRKTVAFFFVASAILFCAWIGFSRPNSSLVGGADQLLGEINVVSLTDHEIGFRIPRLYFHPSAVPPSNSRQGTLLLRVMLPDMSAIETSNAELRAANRWSSVARILVSGAYTDQGTRRKTIGEMVPYLIRLYHIDQTMPALYGLHRLGHGSSVKKAQKEIFLDEDIKNPRTLIICREDKFTKAPYCEMQFEFLDGATVSISFNRQKWLPHWQQVRADSFVLLKNFNENYDKNLNLKGATNGPAY